MTPIARNRKADPLAVPAAASSPTPLPS